MHSASVRANITQTKLERRPNIGRNRFSLNDRHAAKHSPSSPLPPLRGRARIGKHGEDRWSNTSFDGIHHEPHITHFKNGAITHCSRRLHNSSAITFQHARGHARRGQSFIVGFRTIFARDARDSMRAQHSSNREKKELDHVQQHVPQHILQRLQSNIAQSRPRVFSSTFARAIRDARSVQRNIISR